MSDSQLFSLHCVSVKIVQFGRFYKNRSKRTFICENKFHYHLSLGSLQCNVAVVAFLVNFLFNFLRWTPVSILYAKQMLACHRVKHTTNRLISNFIKITTKIHLRFWMKRKHNDENRQ